MPKTSEKSIAASLKHDQVIELPSSWYRQPHRNKLKYFIPDWDDQVDLNFDFETETHSGGKGNWSNQVYAHQMYPTPNYDGILVSRVAIDRPETKKNLIKELGVHRYLRVPREFEVMGDCGAFDYIKEDVPPFSTDEIIDYYEELGFDYGVSIDHLILVETEEKKRFRYELTIHNAEEFIIEHKKRQLEWTPIGAVQGWDPQSYAEAARQYVAMGYDYIALGGMVRSTTQDILAVLEQVKAFVPSHVKVHLFGVARAEAFQDFARLGVHSVDSASALRTAWLNKWRNYLSHDGWYPAIRVRFSNGRDAKRLIRNGEATKAELEAMERRCLDGLAAYYSNPKLPLSAGLLDTLLEYELKLATNPHKKTREWMQQTLEARPWEKCPCSICKRWGIEVLIFRGNNRNRRRGFHNTYVLYEQLQNALISGEEKLGLLHQAHSSAQMSLDFAIREGTV